jgi:hypothetical protein
MKLSFNHARWSQHEVDLLLELSMKGNSIQQCANVFPNRNYAAVANKLSRLRKSCNLWGKDHSHGKQKIIKYWLDKYRPKFVIDAFAGTGITTLIYARRADRVLANEYDHKCFLSAKRKLSEFSNVEIFNKSSDRFLHFISGMDDSQNIDWVDLDPFGMVGSLIPLAFDIVEEGHICCTITDLHSLRFGKANALAWRYLLPAKISNMEIFDQLGFLIGWIIFDCVRRIYPSGGSMVKKAKLIKLEQISILGLLRHRLFKVLFHVEQVSTMNEIRDYINKKLKLFRNNYKLPYLQIAGNKTYTVLHCDQI